MSWTKRQLIQQAFDEIGLAPYVFDLSADQYQSTLRRLDSMISGWESKGIRLGYPLPSNPQDSDLDTQTNVPDKTVDAIFLNLAVRIAPSYGKVVSQETKANAREAYDCLLIDYAKPIEMRLPAGYPVGAGYKPYVIDEPFSQRIETINIGNDSLLDL